MKSPKEVTWSIGIYIGPATCHKALLVLGGTRACIYMYIFNGPRLLV